MTDDERVFQLPQRAGPDATVTTPAADHETCAGTSMEHWTEDGIFANSPRGDLQHDDVEDGKTPAYFTTIDNHFERRPATVMRTLRVENRIVSVTARLEDTGNEVAADYDSNRDALVVRPGQLEINLGEHGRCSRLYIGERRIHGRERR